MAPGGDEVFDGSAIGFVSATRRLRNHNFRLAEIEMGKRQTQDLAAGRVLAREQVECGIGAKLDPYDVVFETRELSPVAVGDP